MRPRSDPIATSQNEIADTQIAESASPFSISALATRPRDEFPATSHKSAFVSRTSTLSLPLHINWRNDVTVDLERVLQCAKKTLRSLLGCDELRYRLPVFRDDHRLARFRNFVHHPQALRLELRRFHDSLFDHGHDHGNRITATLTPAARSPAPGTRWRRRGALPPHRQRVPGAGDRAAGVRNV